MWDLEILNVGQVVKVTGISDDVFVGRVTDIDLEAKGFWLSLEKTSIEDEGIDDEWYFPNLTFFYEVDIKGLKVIS